MSLICLKRQGAKCNIFSTLPREYECGSKAKLEAECVLGWIYVSDNWKSGWVVNRHGPWSCCFAGENSVQWCCDWRVLSLRSIRVRCSLQISVPITVRFRIIQPKFCEKRFVVLIYPTKCLWVVCHGCQVFNTKVRTKYWEELADKLGSGFQKQVCGDVVWMETSSKKFFATVAVVFVGIVMYWVSLE